MTCTFFGHRNMPNKIEPILRSTLIDLIENKDVDIFYVGNSGAAKFKESAQTKGKTVLELADLF